MNGKRANSRIFAGIMGGLLGTGIVLTAGKEYDPTSGNIPNGFFVYVNNSYLEGNGAIGILGLWLASGISISSGVLYHLKGNEALPVKEIATGKNSMAIIQNLPLRAVRTVEIDDTSEDVISKVLVPWVKTALTF
jgi:hypothetical protein